MAKTEKIQKTLTVRLNGKTIVSKPFDFEAACLVDDMRYNGSGGLVGRMHLGKNAVSHMFEGTELTASEIEKLNFAERKRLCEEAADMYFDSLKSEDDSKNE